MGCCLIFGILAASPRLILFGLWLLTDYLAQAGIAFGWGFWGLRVNVPELAGAPAE